MSEYYEKACARLDDECKNGKFDKYGNVMKSAVRDSHPLKYIGRVSVYL